MLDPLCSTSTVLISDLQAPLDPVFNAHATHNARMSQPHFLHVAQGYLAYKALIKCHLRVLRCCLDTLIERQQAAARKTLYKQPYLP